MSDLVPIRVPPLQRLEETLLSEPLFLFCLLYSACVVPGMPLSSPWPRPSPVAGRTQQ